MTEHPDADPAHRPVPWGVTEEEAGRALVEWGRKIGYTPQVWADSHPDGGPGWSNPPIQHSAYWRDPWHPRGQEGVAAIADRADLGDVVPYDPDLAARGLIVPEMRNHQCTRSYGRPCTAHGQHPPVVVWRRYQPSMPASTPVPAVRSWRDLRLSEAFTLVWQEIKEPWVLAVLVVVFYAVLVFA